MPARKYKTEPAQLLAEGERIVNSTSDVKYKHKVEMVDLVLSGSTPSYLSTYCKESKRTITLWVKIADEQGSEVLKSKKPTGRPPRLKAEEVAEIHTVLEEDDPKKYGHNVWDGPSLSAYIKETYAVGSSARQCQRLFHSLGFSLVRPQTLPSKGGKMNWNVWNIKKLNVLPNDPSAIIMYQDEVHFQVTTSVTRKWVIKGSEPKVKSAPGKKSVSYSGYIVPETGEL